MQDRTAWAAITLSWVLAGCGAPAATPPSQQPEQPAAAPTSTPAAPASTAAAEPTPPPAGSPTAGTDAVRPAGGDGTDAVPASALPVRDGEVDRSAYYRIANEHKRPMRGGPTAGWDLMVRKADDCLLVIASHGSPNGQRDVQEVEVGQAGRFERGAETTARVREELARHGLAKPEIDRIVASMRTCRLGFRVLLAVPPRR